MRGRRRRSAARQEGDQSPQQPGVGSVENVIGTIHADVVQIDVSKQSRHVDGNSGNDTLSIDAMGALVSLGIGEVLATGFAPITYSSIETVVMSKSIGRPASLAGDADGDGQVAFPDFLRLAANFGKTDAAWEDGDFNGDGEVTFADFLMLADNFGNNQMGQEPKPSSVFRISAAVADEIFSKPRNPV